MYSLAEINHTTAMKGQALKDIRVNRKRKHRLMLLLAVCWAVGASMAFHMWNSVASADATGVQYTVQPGDTVWQIASRYGRAGDPRTLMDDIILDNHLDAAGDVQPGQVLVIPPK